MLLIGSGVTAGAALVDYSGLPTATAAVHLMTDVTAEENHGGHFGGGWYRHYKHPSDHKRKPIREIYEAIIELAPVDKLAKVHAIVAEYGEKPTAKSARLPTLIIPAPQIDWGALAKDPENVYALARIYDRLLAEYEDEAAMLLLF